MTKTGDNKTKATFKEKMEARKIFFETQDIKKAAKEIGQRPSTVSHWARKEDWRGDLEKIQNQAKESLMQQQAEIKAMQDLEKIKLININICNRISQLALKGVEMFESQLSEPDAKIDISSLKTLVDISNESIDLVYRANGMMSKNENNIVAQNLSMNISSEDRHRIIVESIAQLEKEPAKVETVG